MAPTSIPGPQSAISCPCGWGRCCACECAWTWWRGCVWAWCVSTIVDCGYKALGTEGRVWGPGYPAIWVKKEKKATNAFISHFFMTNFLMLVGLLSKYFNIPDSVQDVGSWDKNLHWIEDLDTLADWATEWMKEKEGERERVRQTEKETITITHLYPHTEDQFRAIHTLSTQTSRNCLCGQVSRQSNQGTPTGLQVHQTVRWRLMEYYR